MQTLNAEKEFINFLVLIKDVSFIRCVFFYAQKHTFLLNLKAEEREAIMLKKVNLRKGKEEVTA